MSVLVKKSEQINGKLVYLIKITLVLHPALAKEDLHYYKSTNSVGFPNIGDIVPPFEALTEKGLVSFPSYNQGRWSIIFAHPANFSSAWAMYSTFLSLKERWFLDRDTRLLAICNEPLGHDHFTEKVRRYIGIFLKAPVVEDLDYRVAHILGIASGRKKHPEHDRIAYVIDPVGVVRLILYNHLKPTVETAVLQLENGIVRVLSVIIDLFLVH